MALTSELSIRFLRPAIGDVLYGARRRSRRSAGAASSARSGCGPATTSTARPPSPRAPTRCRCHGPTGRVEEVIDDPADERLADFVDLADPARPPAARARRDLHRRGFRRRAPPRRVAPHRPLGARRTLEARPDRRRSSRASTRPCTSPTATCWRRRSGSTCTAASSRRPTGGRSPSVADVVDGAHADRRARRAQRSGEPRTRSPGRRVRSAIDALVLDPTCIDPYYRRIGAGQHG